MLRFPATHALEECIPTATVSVIVRAAGYTALSLGQLKIMQEIITLIVFVPFAALVMRQPLRLDFLWAGLCMGGAVYFVFRGTA